jgi:hypothetical protein
LRTLRSKLLWGIDKRNWFRLILGAIQRKDTYFVYKWAKIQFVTLIFVF